MVYDSVYEANNYLRGTVRKQHFWEYFSGSKLQEGSTGTNSYSTSFPNAIGWGSRGSQVSITGGVVDTDFGTTDDNSAVYRTLGYDISGDFELRFKHRFISYTSSTAGMIALADTTDPVYNPSTAGSNSVMVGVNSDAGGAHSFSFYSVENGVFTNHGDAPISTGKTGSLSNATDYWIKMTKVGNLVTITVYNNSGYSTGVVTSCYGSVSSSFPSTLNTIQIGMSWTMSGRGANWTDTDLSLTSDAVGGIRWTTTTGGASIEMNDEADGGLKLYTTSTGTNSNFTMNFDNKRQYSHTGSVGIFTVNADVQQASTTNWFLQVGLGHTVGNTGHWLSAKSAQSYLRLQTSQSESATYSADTTVSNSPSWVTAKIENKSSSCDLSLNGTVAVTNSSGLQTSTGMQPNVYGNRGTSGSAGSNPLVCKLRYFEAYNT